MIIPANMNKTLKLRGKRIFSSRSGTSWEFRQVFRVSAPLGNSRTTVNSLLAFGFWGVLYCKCLEFLYKNCVSLQTSLFTKHIRRVFLTYRLAC